MIISVTAISDPNLLAQIKQAIGGLSWRDGRETAGAVARKVKQNEQAITHEGAGKQLRDRLTPLISENVVVKAATRPRRISAPMISRTADGGHYGAHVDNAMMGAANARIRSDISFTLFLSEPEEYEGGELVIHAAGLTQSIKGRAGELILYPSTSIHEVRPVTGGARIVCVGWIESMIRDPAQREMLFDLENLRANLRQKLPDGSPELLTVDKTVSNLIRMWGQP